MTDRLVSLESQCHSTDDSVMSRSDTQQTERSIGLLMEGSVGSDGQSGGELPLGMLRGASAAFVFLFPN